MFNQPPIKYKHFVIYDRPKHYVELLHTQNIRDILILDNALRRSKKFSEKMENIQKTSEVAEVLEEIGEKAKTAESLPHE